MFESLTQELNSAQLAISKGLLRKISQFGPRYTSYPTADRFTEDFQSEGYLQAVTHRREMGARRALSIYLHIPFCDTVCYYCACNNVVTRDRSKASSYLTYLKREISMQANLFHDMKQVEQIHFGGGSPTYLTDLQLGDIMDHLRQSFILAEDNIGEYAIEVDPRTVSIERIHSMRRQGFNRLSLGVQDFNAAVQLAVNRIQPEEKTLSIIQAARDADFRSVSIDLIYGLPKQTVMTIDETLSKVIAARPDRIAIYNYAHLPHIFKPQRRIHESELPSAESKLDMLFLCIRRLHAAGYVYIGMDHFARPEDDLAIAQRQGRLHRNFQGYSTHAETDLIACGVSAISAVGGSYSQNEKTLASYYNKLDKGEFPVARGISLDMDDLLRRTVIQHLMCNFELPMRSLEIAYPILFKEYFHAELARLEDFAANGLLKMDNDWIVVQPAGRLLIRNICMVFDKYLNTPNGTAHYSKTV